MSECAHKPNFRPIVVNDKDFAGISLYLYVCQICNVLIEHKIVIKDGVTMRVWEEFGKR